ncbi:MAG: bifunctional phosphoribosylaminoimidazolecarboxamide formyltransferase/IMP cyclohydrolase [Thermoplasmatales archaeon]|nr:bifunctional phosphoribosylaminoimidazolecarboxamide formyltransferase/IMP cyclohydrolase [Thermoplasmatales archaeon]
MRIKRALISVSDKTGVADFAKKLQKMGVEIVSTGGTAKILRKNNVNVVDVSKITGFPEMLNGRVKTLHPNIEGGILALRSKKKHMNELKKQNIKPIDMVVVNLYPFKSSPSLENIDIGGVTLVRAGAKNYKNVAVVVNPERYDRIIEELKENNCKLGEKTKEKLASEAFAYTAGYDSIISNYFQSKIKDDFPETVNLNYKKYMDLRYGENPHQKGALYGNPNIKQLHGKELSYNNILDIDAAVNILNDFEKPTVAIVKHTNPTGVASAENLLKAYRLAYQTDTISPFGGIVGLNRAVDEKTANELTKIFLECIVAPKFSKEALTILMKKKNLRLIQVKAGRKEKWNIRSVTNGVLVQNMPDFNLSNLKVVTKRKPTKNELKSMIYAFKVVKHCKSNALVFVKNARTIGIGLGQTSRVDCAWIAGKKSGKKLNGSVMASDAFFPFRDSIDVAVKYGVKAIIQPGGSIRDKEVIDACNEYNIAMVFTGVRVFRH